MLARSYKSLSSSFKAHEYPERELKQCSLLSQATLIGGVATSSTIAEPIVDKFIIIWLNLELGAPNQNF